MTWYAGGIATAVNCSSSVSIGKPAPWWTVWERTVAKVPLLAALTRSSWNCPSDTLQCPSSPMVVSAARATPRWSTSACVEMARWWTCWRGGPRAIASMAAQSRSFAQRGASAKLTCAPQPPPRAPRQSSPAWRDRRIARHGGARLRGVAVAAPRPTSPARWVPPDGACLSGLGAALHAPTELACASTRTDSKRGEDQDPAFCFFFQAFGGGFHGVGATVTEC
jgi:hypothetical protein